MRDPANKAVQKAALPPSRGFSSTSEFNKMGRSNYHGLSDSLLSPSSGPASEEKATRGVNKREGVDQRIQFLKC